MIKIKEKRKHLLNNNSNSGNNMKHWIAHFDERIEKKNSIRWLVGWFFLYIQSNLIPTNLTNLRINQNKTTTKTSNHILE